MFNLLMGAIRFHKLRSSHLPIKNSRALLLCSPLQAVEYLDLAALNCQNQKQHWKGTFSSSNPKFSFYRRQDWLPTIRKSSELSQPTGKTKIEPKSSVHCHSMLPSLLAWLKTNFPVPKEQILFSLNGILFRKPDSPAMRKTKTSFDIASLSALASHGSRF